MRIRSALLVGATWLAFWVAFPAAAATPASWLGGSGSWSNAAQWSSNPLFPCNGNGGQSFDVSISGGSPALDLACSIESLTLSGGSIAGSFDLTVNQPMSWTNGALNGSGQVVAAGGATLTGIAPKSFNGSRSLTLAGPSLWNDGVLLLGSNGAVLRNQSSFAVSGAASAVLDFNKTSSFVNEGTLDVALPTPASILTLSLGSCPNSGAVHVNTGILALSCNGTHSGSFDGPGTLRIPSSSTHVLAAGGSMSGALLEMAGGMLTVPPGASFTPAQLAMSGGTLTLDTPAVLPSLTQTSGTISGIATLELPGLAILNGSMSGSGITRLPNGGTIGASLSGTRTLVLEGGTSTLTAISLGTGGATFRNESGSLLQATGGGAAISTSNTSGSFVNQGTLTIDVGNSTGPGLFVLSAGTSFLGGEIHLVRGILQASKNVSYAGSLEGAGSLQLRAGNHHVLPGANVTVAKVELDNGSSQLTVDAGAGFETGQLIWPRGRIGGNGTVRATAGAVVDQPEGKILAGSVELALAGGSSSWSNGTIELGAGGSTLHNEAGSSLAVTGPTRFLLDSAGFFVTAEVWNEGTVQVALDSAASSLFVMRAALENEGSLELVTGAVRLSDAATFRQTAGTTRLASGTLLRSNAGIALDFQGGTLQGTGTVGADVTSAAVIAPGFSAGTLTVERHLTLLPGGELRPELGGLVPSLDHDFLSVGGNATLGGKLAPSFIGGFEQSVVAGNVFLVLQAATPVTGAFANAASGQRVLVLPDYDSLAVSYGAGSPFGANRVMLHSFAPFVANDSLQVFGTAQGGTITLVVNGQTIVVHTTPGQTAAEVAEAIAAAIRAALGSQGIAGVAGGPVVETNGSFEDPAQVTDPGIHLGGVATIPTLPGVWSVALAVALTALGARRSRR